LSYSSAFFVHNLNIFNLYGGFKGLHSLILDPPAGFNLMRLCTIIMGILI
jgi:hypothetical protein